MAASSNFKASGFTETVMQMSFLISHDLLHLNIVSCSWHFCVYFWLAQAFLLHLDDLVVENIFDVFDFPGDHTIEVSHEFLGGAPSS